MKELMTSLAVVSMVGAVVACEPYGVGPDEVPENGAANTWLPATYASEWVGVYVGSGTVDVLETDTTYSDQPVCIEVWIEERDLPAWGLARYLFVNIYLSVLPAPRDLEDISDGYYAGGSSECVNSEGSLVLQGASSIKGVNSQDTLSMRGPPGVGWPAEKWQQMRVTRGGGGFQWGAWVYRRKTAQQYGKWEIATLDLFVAKTK